MFQGLRVFHIFQEVCEQFVIQWEGVGGGEGELDFPAHQLISEPPTRWGSRQEMIETVLEQERAKH